MSYSVCLNCHEMVSDWEKYCTECLEAGFQQDLEYWKACPSREQQERDLARDWDQLSAAGKFLLGFVNIYSPSRRAKAIWKGGEP